MITADMQRLIEQNTIGLVATVNDDGTPSVSPKGTTVVLDDRHVAFSDLRSPGTVRNIQVRPAVELNYIDVFSRKAVRLRGLAQYHKKGDRRFAELLPRFGTWQGWEERMRGIVVVEVSKAELIRSPAYDMGGVEAELQQQWLKTYTARLSGGGQT